MKTIGATDFKTHCLALLDEVASEGESLVILKRGKPVARLIPYVEPGESPQASLRGTVVSTDDLLESAVSAHAWEAVGDG